MKPQLDGAELVDNASVCPREPGGYAVPIGTLWEEEPGQAISARPDQALTDQGLRTQQQRIAEGNKEWWAQLDSNQRPRDYKCNQAVSKIVPATHSLVVSEDYGFPLITWLTRNSLSRQPGHNQRSYPFYAWQLHCANHSESAPAPPPTLVGIVPLQHQPLTDAGVHHLLIEHHLTEHLNLDVVLFVQAAPSSPNGRSGE